MTVLTHHGRPVTLVRDHATGWKVRRGGSPGYATIREADGTEKTIRRDLLIVALAH